MLQQSPGTLLLVTDGADVAQLPTLKDDSLQVLVLALGSSPTLKQLASALDAPLGSSTLNDDVPAIKAMEVMTIGRKRRRQASSAASMIPLP